MAKELYTLEGCLQQTRHHVAPHKVTLMVIGGAGIEDFKYRFELVDSNLQAALAQIEKIRKVAQEKGCADILKVLDEKTVPAGHDSSVRLAAG